MKKLLIGMTLLSTLSVSTFAKDEYLSENSEHGGKTQVIIGETAGVIVRTAEVIADISKTIFEQIKKAEFDHSIEIGQEENDEQGGQGRSRFIRYSVESAFYQDGSERMNIQVLPVKLTLEAEDGGGLSVREARVAVMKLQSDFGISIEGITYAKGDDEAYGTSVLSKDFEKVTFLSLKYADVLYGSNNGNHKILLKTYFDFNMEEKVTNLDGSQKFKYYEAYDYGAALGYQYHSDYLNTKITPEVFYRKANAASYRDEKTDIRHNSGYDAKRVGFQLVLQKSILNKDCKLTFGVAKEEITGDMNINNQEVYAKGKCNF